MLNLSLRGFSASPFRMAEGLQWDQNDTGGFPNLSPVWVSPFLMNTFAGAGKSGSAIEQRDDSTERGHFFASGGCISAGLSLAQIVVCSLRGEVALAAHAEVSADEWLEGAVEDLVDVADFDAGAEILCHAVGL